MLESEFQAYLITKLEKIFKGCIILKNDANYIQGFPDLLILWGRHWATLECKKSETSPYRPNQKYYIGYCDDMSFSRMICPENEMEVIHELKEAFGI